jgi:hypothetical protein
LLRLSTNKKWLFVFLHKKLISVFVCPAAASPSEQTLAIRNSCSAANRENSWGCVKIYRSKWEFKEPREPTSALTHAPTRSISCTSFARRTHRRRLFPFARIVKRKQYKRVGKKRQEGNRRQNNNRKRRKSLKFLERRALSDCAISHWLRNFKRAPL